MTRHLGEDRILRVELAEKLEHVGDRVDEILEELRSPAICSGTDQMALEIQLSRVHDIIGSCYRRLLK